MQKSEEQVGKSLTKYEEAVETLAQGKSKYIFQNDNIAHAAIVIKKILEYSKKDIAIFDDDLSGDVSGKSANFLDVLRDSVIKDGKNLHIAVKKKVDEPESNIARTLRELAKLYPDKVKVKVASPEFLKAVDEVVREIKINEYINFAVGDNNSFRLEFPAGKRKAFCSFNNDEFSPKLLGIFKAKFDKCEDYFQENSGNKQRIS